MTDYTPNNDYSVKDGLSTSDPEKLILGSDLDSEFEEIQTAVNSKLDSTDIATQAQAEAGTNNTTIMTPLRVSELLAEGGTSGALGDIKSLDDPGADRIMFWDESDDTVEWLQPGNGLTITANVIDVVTGTVDHDALLNYVANEHIDHTAVTITAGPGLQYTTGGTDITTSSTIEVDIDALTESADVQPTSDFLMMYDASALAITKVQADALLGDALGDGKFYRSTDSALSVASRAAVVWNTTSNNNLQRGTYDTGTGLYTATVAVRVYVSAQIFVLGQPAGNDTELRIVQDSVNGSSHSRSLVTNRGKYGASSSTVSTSSVVELAVGEAVLITAETSTACDMEGNIYSSYMNIIELG